MSEIIIATTKPWNISNFGKMEIKGEWCLVTDKFGLNQLIRIVNPRYIFFPH